MAYVPPRGEKPQESRPTVAARVLLVLGGLLLLPGACSIFFAASMFLSGPRDFLRQVERDPYMQAIMVLWGICLAVSLGGLLLILLARRRRMQ